LTALKRGYEGLVAAERPRDLRLAQPGTLARRRDEFDE
jgi:hypothetical protein